MYVDICLAIPLSNTERSSVISVFSRHSTSSSLSEYSLDTATIDHQTTDSFSSAPQAIEQQWIPQVCAIDTPSSHGSQPSHAVLHNQTSAYHAPIAATAKPTCFACNKEFATPSTLSRHQTEQCDRAMEWTCSSCPNPKKTFYRTERLEGHHVKEHGDRCGNGCGKEKKISSKCKAELSRSFVEPPAKKAWGCPYCVSWFSTSEAWNSHCTAHCTQKDKVATWSYARMIWSLLQPYLSKAHVRYPWDSCDWTKVTEKNHPGLRELLERCRLPPDLHDCPEYRKLSPADGVLRYVFFCIMLAQPLSNQVFIESPSGPLLQPCGIPHNTGVAHKNQPYVPILGPRDEYLGGFAPSGRTSQALALSHIGRQHDDTINQPDSATIPSEIVNKQTGFTLQSHSTRGMKPHDDATYQSTYPTNHNDMTLHAELHPPMLQPSMLQHHGMYSKQRQKPPTPPSSDTGRRVLRLKTSFPKLPLRTSASKSNMFQPEITQPTPAKLDGPKLSASGKLGTVLTTDEDCGGRPMSGILETWTEFLNDQQPEQSQVAAEIWRS